MKNNRPRIKKLSSIALTLAAFIILAAAFPFVSGLMQKSGEKPRKQLAAPSAVGVTATLTDNVSTAQNSGATIIYTATINNTGGTDATGVKFSDTLSSIETLVGSSVKASPIAVDETFDAVGNTQ